MRTEYISEDEYWDRVFNLEDELHDIGRVMLEGLEGEDIRTFYAELLALGRLRTAEIHALMITVDRIIEGRYEGVELT